MKTIVAANLPVREVGWKRDATRGGGGNTALRQVGMMALGLALLLWLAVIAGVAMVVHLAGWFGGLGRRMAGRRPFGSRREAP